MLMFAGVLSPILAMLRSSQAATRGAAIAAMKSLAHGICCELDEAGALQRGLFQKGYGPKGQESVGLPKLSRADIDKIRAVLRAALPDLIALVASHDSDVQQAAAEALLALTWQHEYIISSASGAVNALAAQLESKHQYVQVAVAHALVPFACRYRLSMTSAGVVPALVAQLKSANKQVQQAAAKSIGDMLQADTAFGKDFVAANLLPALKALTHMQPSKLGESNNSEVQFAAVYALDCLRRYFLPNILAAGMMPSVVLLLSSATPKVQAAVLVLFMHSLNNADSYNFQEAIIEAGAFSHNMKPCLKPSSHIGHSTLHKIIQMASCKVANAYVLPTGCSSTCLSHTHVVSACF